MLLFNQRKATSDKRRGIKMKKIGLVIPAVLGLGMMFYNGSDVKAASISNLKPYEQKIVTKNNTKLYTNSHLNSSSKAKQGTVYQANGYRNINGKKYYRVYQSNYKGYVLASHTQTLKAQKVNKSYFMNKKSPYNQWSNLYFDKTKGQLPLNEVVYAKYIYRLPNGKAYYSIYNNDNRDKWMGYVNTGAFKELKAVKLNPTRVNLKENMTIYGSLNGDVVRGKTNQFKNQYVIAKYRYDLVGRTIYSVYNEAGNWIGYVEAYGVQKTITPYQISQMNSFIEKAVKLVDSATEEQRQTRPYQALMTATKNAHITVNTTVDDWYVKSMKLCGRIENIINLDK